jgi:hypothetical protein
MTKLRIKWDKVKMAVLEQVIKSKKPVSFPFKKNMLFYFAGLELASQHLIDFDGEEFSAKFRHESPSLLRKQSKIAEEREAGGEAVRRKNTTSVGGVAVSLRQGRCKKRKVSSRLQSNKARKLQA